MKKTIITLLAMAGVATANDGLVYSVTDVDFSTKQWIDLTSFDLTSAINGTTNEGGFTVMLTMSDWKTANGPVGWFTTEAYSSETTPSYSKSAATFGYGTSNGAHKAQAITWSSGGSANDQANNGQQIGVSASDNANQLSFSVDATTLFMTVANGSVTMYEITKADNTVVAQVAQSSGLTSGDITGLYIGHWNGGNPTNSGTMGMEIYSGIKDIDWMNSKVAAIPEPTTATLSLLALAGLAARRRRK